MLQRVSCVAALLLISASASAQQPCTTDARHVVDEMYRHMLERTPDPGSAAWVDKLSSAHMTIRQVVRELAKSPEHMQRFFNPAEGPVANERAVANLYRHILGRQPDAGGLRSFTDMAARQGLGAVVDTIINSPEYQRTFGDWGIPGSGGLVYCGSNTSQASQPGRQTNGEIRFRSMDRNNDGTITRDEWRGDPASFNVHDWNGDGVLSGDEVRVGAHPPANSLEGRNVNTGLQQDRFDYLDVNGNGVVEENEWDGSLEAFDRLDRNHDRRLSRAELGNVRNSSFTALDIDRDGRIRLDEWPWSHSSFDQQDTNGDGVITRDEFRGGAVPTTGR